MDPDKECQLSLTNETIAKILDPIREERMFVPELRRLEKGLNEMNRKFRALEETYAESFKRTQELETMIALYHENWA